MDKLRINSELAMGLKLIFLEIIICLSIYGMEI